MPRALRLSLTTEGAMYPPGEQHRVLDVARAADQAGADFVDVTEHVLMGLHTLDEGRGWEPHHLDMPQPEVLSTLAAMAGATQRIGLISSIVIAPLRPAGLLAKTAATLHALSRGRFVMGVTTSWQRDEYDALGVDFARRGQILDDTIGACRALWEQAPATFSSPTVNFSGMFCQPRPAPGERIRVWFGGKCSPRNVRRIVSLGDGWMPYGGLHLSAADKAAAISLLRERYTAAGRDPDSLDVCDALSEVDGSLERSLEQVPDLAAAGVTIIRIHLRRFAHTPDEVLPTVERAIRLFEPYRGASLDRPTPPQPPAPSLRERGE